MCKYSYLPPLIRYFNNAFGSPIQGLRKCPVRVSLEVLRRGRAAREGSLLQGLDEEDYDALPEAEEEKLMERYRVKLRQMKLRYKLVEADTDRHFLFLLQHKLCSSESGNIY